MTNRHALLAHPALHGFQRSAGKRACHPRKRVGFRAAIAAMVGAIAALTVGCSRPPDQPDELIVHFNRDSAVPLLLVDDAVVYPNQRDSVLRWLRGATLDSLLVLPGGIAETTALFGSRGAHGVVLVYTRGR